MEKYEEYNIVSPFWGWIMLLALCAALVAFGLFAHSIIPEIDRYWDFGQFPIVPSEHPASSFRPPDYAVVPDQLPPLPEVPLHVQETSPVNTFGFGALR